MEALPDWPRAFGTPPVRGRMRAAPEDFQVDEQLPYEPDGAGNHLWLRVCKRGANTEWVAEQLAALAGVGRGAVGYAGLKDRHAVTTQWFSLPLAGGAEPPPPWREWGGEEFSVIEAVRHRAALRRGELAGNRFRITLRELSGDLEALAARVAQIARDGVPNYFGEQRFGHDGDNVRHAEAMFNGAREVRDRHLRGLYLSAARSFLFNQVLGRRVEEGTWNRAIDGDFLVLRTGNRHFIGRFDQPEVIAGIDSGRLHPTGPLWGRGPSLVKRAAFALEQEALGEYGVLQRGLEAADLRQERRPLRLIPEGLSLESGGDFATLTFALPPGCYATAVLRELADSISA